MKLNALVARESVVEDENLYLRSVWQVRGLVENQASILDLDSACMHALFRSRRQYG
jgi:hypothetical protein